jgi:type I restriction enzyme M protein
VIGLPANLFFGTGIPAAILVFDRAREADETKEILFIDSSAHYTPGKNQNELGEEDLRRIMDVYDNFTQGGLKPGVVIDKYAYVALPGEIQENDYNLNIPRYVDTFEPEPPVDMKAVNARIIDTKSKLEIVHEEMQEILEKLGLS